MCLATLSNKRITFGLTTGYSREQQKEHGCYPRAFNNINIKEKIPWQFHKNRSNYSNKAKKN